MANQLSFTDAQIAALDAKLRDVAGFSDVTVGKYRPVYDLVNAWVQPSGVDSKTKLFFQRAPLINSNANTAANTYIRTVTKRGLQLPPFGPAGSDSDESIQTTSNRIARGIFIQMLNVEGVPPLVEIVRLDVTGAIVQGDQTWGGWGGSLFFLPERAGPSRQSIAKLIFSDRDETAKFEKANIAAGRATIQTHGYSDDFVGSARQAVVSGITATRSSNRDLNSIRGCARRSVSVESWHWHPYWCFLQRRTAAAE